MVEEQKNTYSRGGGSGGSGGWRGDDFTVPSYAVPNRGGGGGAMGGAAVGKYGSGGDHRPKSGYVDESSRPGRRIYFGNVPGKCSVA